ncbi:MarR family winged helix-turn-helix transcriptional regulator [Sanguibacter antarcticus]|uniref:DNA-binding MarR family transcriptional regulator n=1 Tax=Sanguibacter antarcticus TaxID=372484 RepID=A0A2A9E525_9MICO|nr:MarR family transcriptional regulator [Sanguibacter antarcticus]PFG33279.1 DNA-binding MarR family transcriptional regulator [Sanguibacter antarcticus]
MTSGTTPTDDAARQDTAGSEFLALVHASLRRVRRDAQLELEPTGTTPGQYRLLRVLARADGPQRLCDVASALDVVPRSVTSKVEQAHAAGLVRRLPDPVDRRSTRVELTDAGHELLATVGQHRRERADDLLHELSSTDRSELLRLLRLVANDPETTSAG